MKRFTLTLTILCAFFALAYAGTERYSGREKEVLQPAPPACEWYRAHEWDLNIWGTYVFSANTGNYDTLDTDIFDSANTGRPDIFGETETINTGHTSRDRLTGKDNTWGGGADVKFFFNKYFGLGAEGFVLAARNAVGAGLGTATFRFPIGCSRFAPYVWGGFGALGGGGGYDHFFNEHPRRQQSGDAATEKFYDRFVPDNHTRVDGQIGAGIEIRITRHIGVMGDFAWNFIGGQDSDNQDFGMVRSGITLSY